MVDLNAFASLRIGSDGIWYPTNSADEAVSYPTDGNALCFQVEDSSFWFKHRNACITTLVKAFPPPEGSAVFDIGGGNGFVCLGLMAEGFETVLVEPGRVGAINAKNRGIPNVVCATTAEAGFREGSIGAIGLFDVVEHIADDREFVASMRSLLCPGGRLYVTVPAYSHLWSTEDEHAGHYRRYSRAAIEAVLRQCGFSVEYSTYIFRPLPVPVFLARTLPYRLKIAPARDAARDVERDHKPANELVRGAVAAALSGEVKNIERRRRMRFGGSVLLVATATQA